MDSPTCPMVQWIPWDFDGKLGHPSSKIVQTQVLFALDARDSYLLIFVRTVTVMRTIVFYVLFVSQMNLMVWQQKLSFVWIMTSVESGFTTIAHLERTMRPASSCVKIVLPLEAFFVVVVVVKFLESVLRVFVQFVLSLMLVPLCFYTLAIIGYFAQ